MIWANQRGLALGFVVNGVNSVSRKIAWHS